MIVSMSAGAARFLRAGCDVRKHVAGNVTRFAERVDMHAVGDFAGHAQHPRIHRGDIHFGIGCIDGPGAPLRGDEVQIVEIAVVVELARPEGGETRFHGAHVVTQPWARLLEGHAVAPHDVRPDLGTDAEPELAAGGFLQLPCRRCRDERTTRKRHGDTGGQFKSRRGLRCDRGTEIRRPAGLGQQKTRETGRLGALGKCAHLSQRLRNGHHVDVHSGSLRLGRRGPADPAVDGPANVKELRDVRHHRQSHCHHRSQQRYRRGYCTFARRPRRCAGARCPSQ